VNQIEYGSRKEIFENALSKVAIKKDSAVSTPEFAKHLRITMSRENPKELKLLPKDKSVFSVFVSQTLRRLSRSKRSRVRRIRVSGHGSGVRYLYWYGQTPKTINERAFGARHKPLANKQSESESSMSTKPHYIVPHMSGATPDNYWIICNKRNSDWIVHAVAATENEAMRKVNDLRYYGMRNGLIEDPRQYKVVQFDEIAFKGSISFQQPKDEFTV
jgi:hypothetical protein